MYRPQHRECDSDNHAPISQQIMPTDNKLTMPPSALRYVTPCQSSKRSVRLGCLPTCSIVNVTRDNTFAKMGPLERASLVALL